MVYKLLALYLAAAGAGGMNAGPMSTTASRQTSPRSPGNGPAAVFLYLALLAGLFCAALFRSRPLIISDVASYSMVPDDLAYKISYGEDPEDLAAALMQIFSKPEEAEAKAVKARAWAKDSAASSRRLRCGCTPAATSGR